MKDQKWSRFVISKFFGKTTFKKTIKERTISSHTRHDINTFLIDEIENSFLYFLSFFYVEIHFFFCINISCFNSLCLLLLDNSGLSCTYLFCIKITTLFFLDFSLLVVVFCSPILCLPSLDPSLFHPSLPSFLLASSSCLVAL